ncbi:MAG: type II secretion system F family protein [Deltaproteobacteria bacterium]|nr:type II secretion system F family protein [Deltaproteobacteria bacterium]
MKLPIPTDVAKWIGAGAILVALTVATYAVVSDPAGLPRRYWGRYVAFLGRQLRRMFIFSPPETIAYAQLAGIFLFFALGLLADLPAWWAFAGVVIVGPAFWIEKMRQKRIEAIEEQIDGFILALANALKSTPSIGDAFKSVATVIPDPLKQEVQLANKEMRVGSTLDQALLLMASRVGSRQLDTALSAVLVGRQVGGNLPKILDTIASSLREMKRLEGVVRTKTAEGKMQLWVLAIFPFGLMFMINAVSPGYFSPLTESFIGYVLVVLASLFWIGSLVLARKILAVDL